MHPILKDRRSLFLYLLAWLALALMLSALLAIPGRASATAALAFTLPLMFLYAFMSLSAWYICRAFPLATTNIARLLLTNVIAALLSSSLWVAVGFGWVFVLESLQPGLALHAWHMESLPLLAAAGTLLFFLASTVHYLMATFEASRAAERTALELRVLAREAELKALRAQIDPHFLFNSLNSISALTATDPRSARTMTVKLAEFLRLSMQYGALETISLEQELSLVLRFLDIEKVRFGSRLMIDTDIDEAAKTCRIAPLLLQPLVENAVGHGIASMVDGGTIRVTGTCVDSQVRITIENPLEPGRRMNPGTGLGLENVRQRLRGLYGVRGRIDIVEEPARYAATVSLPAGP